jgi:hypothetical protein
MAVGRDKSVSRLRSETTDRFWKAFGPLPSSAQRGARQAFRLFQQNPAHASLHFKKIHETKPIYSIRIGRTYRALGTRAGDSIVWFWIGSHADYDRLISKL